MSQESKHSSLTQGELSAIEGRIAELDREPDPEQNADGDICAECGSMVDVRSGCDFDPGDICDSCWQEVGRQAHRDRVALLAEVKRLKKRFRSVTKEKK